MAAPPSSNGTFACPQCQAALPADATFCLRCGARVSFASTSATSSANTATSAAAAAAALARARSGTLLGVSLDAMAAPVSATAPAVATAPTAAVSAVTSSTAAPEGSATVVSPRRVVNAHATMMGITGPVANPHAPVGSAPPPSGTFHGVAPAGASPQVAPMSPRMGTIQGVTPPAPTPTPAPGFSNTSTGRHRREVMLDAQPSDPLRVGPPTPDLRSSDGMGTNDFDEIPGIKKSGGGSVFGLVFAALLLGLGGVGGWWWYTHRPQPVASLPATLRTQPDGSQVVSLSVPGAAPGTSVRYTGVTHPLDAQGRAEFPVTLPADRVGYVEVPVEVIPPGGAAQTRTLRFLVAWRAETDLHKLGEDPPKIHIVFHVARGSSLSIAGQSIRVSGETGIAELPAPAPSPAGDGDARRERFPVRVVLPDGAAVDEQYELRVPRAQLRVNEPSPVALVDTANIVVRGSAPHATRVRIGGQAATLSGDTFSAIVPLANGSNSLDVVAYSSEGAPSLVNLAIYRGVSADAYLVARGGDRGVNALIARPPVNGSALRVTGTVVGAVIPSPDGPSCQLVVENRLCPGGRCTAWINLPTGTNVTPNVVVDVVGEIRGARAYTTQSGERRSDPVVQAVVLTARR